MKRFWSHVSKANLEAWLKTRPECVQQLAAEFPINDDLPITLNGKPYGILGYNEKDAVILYPMDAESYEEAIVRRVYFCAKHLRENPSRVFDNLQLPHRS